MSKYIRSINTYQFDLYDYTLINTLYASIKKEDRVIFIIRHAERGKDCSEQGGLITRGIQQAKDLGIELKGGRFGDTKNDFYGSTEFRRTMETTYYLGLSRGYKIFKENKLTSENWESYPFITHPIDVINYNFYCEEGEGRYEKNKQEGGKKSLKMIDALCKLTENHPFSWITTHDTFIIPFLCWLSEEHLSFSEKARINYLSGVAIIVHKNFSWEAYPVRSLKRKSIVYR